jgi:hypothetical protein
MQRKGGRYVNTGSRSGRNFVNCSEILSSASCTWPLLYSYIIYALITGLSSRHETSVNNKKWRGVNTQNSQHNKREDCALQACLCKGKRKVHPRTVHATPQGKYGCSSTLSLTLALDGIGWSKPRSDFFIPGKQTRCPLFRRLCGLQVRLLRIRKISVTGIRLPDHLKWKMHALEYITMRVLLGSVTFFDTILYTVRFWGEKLLNI